MSFNSPKLAPFILALGAMFWATDSLFRVTALESLDPVWIVFFEHLIVITLLLPFFLRDFKSYFTLGFKEWLSALFVGAGASGIATLLFTASFVYLNPSLTILLQKLQPIIAVLFAVIILGERPSKWFYVWALVAMAAAFVMSYPKLDFSFLTDESIRQSKGVLFALGACTLWALATTAGKVLVSKATPHIATFWRYVFGLFALIYFVQINEHTVSWELFSQKPSLTLSLFYMALIPGFLAMRLYYKGLSGTSASVAALVELVFPVTAILLNTVLLKMPLTEVQLGAGGVLLIAITVISFLQRN